MARKLKLGWETKCESTLFLGTMINKRQYKDYLICLTSNKPYKPSTIEKGGYLTYLVCPNGATYVKKGYVPFDFVERYIDSLAEIPLAQGWQYAGNKYAGRPK